MIIDQLTPIASPQGTDELPIERGQLTYKITWDDLAGEDITALQTGKQNVLISGTNIKTLNGQSVLGSGDLSVGGQVHVGTSAPSDPNIQIWLDTDEPGMSGVSSVNGATGAVVLDAADVGATPEWTLMWTNASPSSEFAAQTISIDLSQYSEIMVTASVNANDLYVNDYIMKIDGRKKVMEQLINVGAIDNVQVVSREVTPTESSVTFENAYDKPVTQNTGTVKNIRLRPYYIYAR